MQKLIITLLLILLIPVLKVQAEEIKTSSEFKDGIEKINELKTYNYTYKNDKEQIPHVGVIAQDLQKVFPNSVEKGADGYLRIRQDEMFYAMINAIKQLNNSLHELMVEVKLLFKKIQDICVKLVQLEKSTSETNKKIKDLEQEQQRLKREM